MLTGSRGSLAGLLCGSQSSQEVQAILHPAAHPRGPVKTQWVATWPLSDLLPPSCPMLTSPHSLQRYLLLVMELKVSPQLLHPGFSLSRLVLEDSFLDSIYKEASDHHQLQSISTG